MDYKLEIDGSVFSCHNMLQILQTAIMYDGNEYTIGNVRESGRRVNVWDVEGEITVVDLSSVGVKRFALNKLGLDLIITVPSNQWRIKCFKKRYASSAIFDIFRFVVTHKDFPSEATFCIDFDRGVEFCAVGHGNYDITLEGLTSLLRNHNIQYSLFYGGSEVCFIR